MLKCTREITEDQIGHMLQFKYNPNELKYQTHESLMNIEWNDLRWKGEITEEAKRPVEVSQIEQMMTNEVEDLSEDMLREKEEANRAGLGKTQLAFMDLENMSNNAKVACIIAATLFFTSVAYFFYQIMIVMAIDPLRVKKQEMQAKKR